MKTQNQIFGDLGEAFAMQFLKKKNYKLLDCNYKCKDGEIDIIARKNGVYVFVEVKTRSTDFMLPQEAVNVDKENNIFETAKHFMRSYALKNVNYRFDIIEILGTCPEDFVVNHLENAF